MRWERFAVSARMAWQRSVFRYTVIALVATVVTVSGWFAWQVFALRSHPEVVIHYSVSLGVDDVRSWPWLFLPIGVWWALTALDLFAAFLYHRHDPHASWALLVLACAFCAPWIMALYSLVHINT